MFMKSLLEGVISRRALVGGTLGGLAAAGLTACGAPNGSEEEPAAAGASGTDGALDFSKPADNLHAFGKIWGTFADKPVYMGFQGVQFARIGVNKLVPLFGYVGCGNNQSMIDENGHLWVRGTEAGYFTDLASGEIIDYWDNPYSGERVEVFPFLNDRFRGRVTEEMPRYAMGDVADDTRLNPAEAVEEEDGMIPFRLPFQRAHDQYLMALGIYARVRQPGHARRLAQGLDRTQDQPLRALRFLYTGSRAG